MAIFGNSNNHPATWDIKNAVRGSVFTITERGEADSIEVRLKNSSERLVRCAIYIHNGGVLTLLTNGVTESKTIPVSSELLWYSFSFPTKPTLEANTEYVLVAAGQSGGTACYMCSIVGATNIGHEDTDSDAWSAFPKDPADFNHTDNKYSIYCTYTPLLPSPETTLTVGGVTREFISLSYTDKHPKDRPMNCSIVLSGHITDINYGDEIIISRLGTVVWKGLVEEIESEI